MYRFWFALTAFILTAFPVNADVRIEALELRAGIDGRPGIIFGKLTNTGATADRLIRVDSPDARIEMHTHEMRGNVMRMRRTDAFLVPADGNLTLKSGHHHLMVFDWALEKQGTPLSLTFKFDESPSISVSASPGKAYINKEHKGHKGH